MTTSRGNKGSDGRVCLQRRRPRFNPALGRSTGEGNGNSLLYSGLGSPTDRGTWWATVHGGHKELDTTEVTWHTHTCTHINVYTHTHTHIYIYTHTYIEKGFPDSSVVKESACNAGDPDSIPGSGRSAGEGIDSWTSLVTQW